MLGKAYYIATDIENNRKKALFWFNMAADQKNLEAQFRLADLYVLGKGTEKNEFTAYDWYLKSAIQGYPKALTRLQNLYHIEKSYNLGYIYHHNTEIKWNHGEAVKFYAQAAEKGQVYAQSGLAYLYMKGLRMNMDYSRAHFWYTKINLKSLEKLATHVFFGDGHAMLSIGMKYYDGHDFDRNKDIAFRWISRSAKTGLTSSQCPIAKMFKEGDCVEQNYHKASIWYMRAAKKGDSDAQYNLGLMYYQGLGVKKDSLEASKWFIFAAEKGHSGAQCYFGILRLNGDGLRQDTLDAIKWFTISSKQKNPEAIYKIAKMYEVYSIYSKF
ncbi:HCP-like protein [Backusella circina FSU 941]|nr:HCP-like protein [Backusella circina FSU 941]